MIRPLNGYVLVEPLYEPFRVVLAEPQWSTSPVPPLTRGKVLARGHGKFFSDGTRKPITVEVGDLIQFERYHALEVRDRRRKLYLLDENYILAQEVG